MAEAERIDIGVGEADGARRIAVLRGTGKAPAVIWLGGYRSDMAGTKAEALDKRGAENGQCVVRFDYSGHGRSGGDFLDGSISRWLAESSAVIEQNTDAPPILVGSSMGGYLALLTALGSFAAGTPVADFRRAAHFAAD